MDYLCAHMSKPNGSYGKLIYDNVMLKFALQMYKVYPKLANLITGKIISNFDKLWIWKLKPEHSELIRFGSSFCNTKLFCICKALQLMKNVSLDFAIQSILMLFKWGSGPLIQCISAERDEPAIWNDSIEAVSSAGKYHCLAMIQEIISAVCFILSIYIYCCWMPAIPSTSSMNRGNNT